MSTIILQIPDTFELNPKDTIRFLAAKLYESGKLSLGQSAELTGLSKSTFAEILVDYGVSIINYSFEDVMSVQQTYSAVIADASCFKSSPILIFVKTDLPV